MKNSASARLAALEQRLAPARDGWTLEARIRSWELQGILAQLTAIDRGEPQPSWPKLPPNLSAREQTEALAILARMDQELRDFAKNYPEYIEVFRERRSRGGTKDTEP
ncbi:MAG: hypothetical protein U0744_04610 [Gemmataceae bacterium]